MFRIRRIYDDSLPINRQATSQVQEILKVQFSGHNKQDIDKLPEHLRNPLKYMFQSILSAADQLLKGYSIAYALVRPPGYHAERHVFGEFCYFNSASVAAYHLSQHGKVAILDIDYHHGNGQQSIFYDRADVLTVSIQGHPRYAYPYFSGFTDEIGEGAGVGFNLNLPQPERLNGEQYRKILDKALKRIQRFGPQFVIIALGFDTAKGDPTGSWSLNAKDFEQNGYFIGSLGLPFLVVQEGGYAVRSLGINARHFFSGLWQGFNDHYNNHNTGVHKNANT